MYVLGGLNQSRKLRITGKVSAGCCKWLFPAFLASDNWQRVGLIAISSATDTINCEIVEA